VENVNKLEKSPENTRNAALVQTGIEAVLQAYEEALNASDSAAVLRLFTDDAVFMAPNNPPAVGTGPIHDAYKGIFEAITFDTELSVQEIVQLAPDWALVRTNSNGHVTVKAIKQRVPDANHELFIFQKDHKGSWKIARYAFAASLSLPH
jgi:uncharacterized protein (TIGR02246 family)